MVCECGVSAQQGGKAEGELLLGLELRPLCFRRGHFFLKPGRCAERPAGNGAGVTACGRQ